MKSKEIGSEFWEADINGTNTIMNKKPQKFLLSGRTALDFIIRDIKNTRKLKVVYLPSYCCHTMIQPFIDNQIQVVFYKVYYDNYQYVYDIDFNTDCDAVLIMQYFGYLSPKVEKVIETFASAGKVIIEDATHSWLTKYSYSKRSDYIFISYRKWTGLPCGSSAIKQAGEFTVDPPCQTKEEYVTIRKRAAQAKKKYIETGYGSKQTFLNDFELAERLLESDYINYKMPDCFMEIIKRLDIEKIKKKRIENATFLYSGLKNCEQLMMIKLTEGSVPIFVPIIVLSKQRNNLRKYLIQNDVYCPVHWPLSPMHRNFCKDLYEDGLSLVCDQRYSESDMSRIVNLIKVFLEGKLE